MFYENKFAGLIETRYKNDFNEIEYWLGVDFRRKKILQNSILELKRIEDLTRLKATILIENKKSFAIFSKYLDLKIYQSERKTLPFRAGI